MQWNRWKQQVIYFESMESKTRTSSDRKDLHRVRKKKLGRAQIMNMYKYIFTKKVYFTSDYLRFLRNSKFLSWLQQARLFEI